MVSLYNEIVNFDGVNFRDHADRIGMFNIFQGIFESTEFEDNFLQIKIAKYIAFSHSKESTKLSIGGDRRKEIRTIFKELEIPEDYYNGVVLLKNKIILKAVQLWMDKMDSRQTEYLLTLQNAYMQQQAASLSDLKKPDGASTDYDQKFKCIEYMDKLKKMIKDAEIELQQKDPKMKEAYKEVKKASPKLTVGPETYAL